jgi:hypothetical protein
MRPDLRLVPTGPDLAPGPVEPHRVPGRPDADAGPGLPRPRDALAVEPVGDGSAPHGAECLPCYLARLLDRHGCDGTLRWSMRWRDARAPRATKLDRRLGDRGGFCDCEVLLNVYPQHDPRGGCDGRATGEAMTPCRRPSLSWW